MNVTRTKRAPRRVASLQQTSSITSVATRATTSVRLYAFSWSSVMSCPPICKSEPKLKEG